MVVTVLQHRTLQGQPGTYEVHEVSREATSLMGAADHS